MPLSLIKTNSIAAGNITSALITSVANTAIVGRIATAQQPTGAVLQVVSTQPAGAISSTTANAILTSLSITPSSASSRILLFGSVEGERNGGTGGNYIFGQLRKNTTNIRSFMNAAGYQQTTGARNYNSFSYIDSPATTSAITYDIWIDHTTSGAASGITWGWYSASIHALEIAS